MSAPARYRVWDAPTRIVHWLLVAGFALQYLSGELDLLPMRWHYRVGYALVALLVFRVAWGIVGSDSARFASFVRGGGAVAAYLRDLRAGLPGARPGHNPIGGWSVLALLAALLLQSVTGLYASDDIAEAGPLAAGASAAVVEAMSSIHRVNPKVLLALVAVHVLAVAWHARYGREDLVRAMFDGRKALERDPSLRFAHWGRAAVVLALCAAAVWAIVELA